MKKILFAVLMLAGLNFASISQTTPSKKAPAKTEVTQNIRVKETPKKIHHNKANKHYKKHITVVKKEQVKAK